MSFTISGRICEQESKRPIPGLIVRALDPDDRFEHLLAATATDADGRFQMVYQESAATELFKARPQVYLRVYAPPWRALLDSPRRIEWAGRAEERVEIEIARDLLGPLSPARPDGVVEVGINLTANALTIEKQDQFDVPRLPGFKNGGPVGAPTLPEQIQTIVLPRGARNLKLEVEPGRSARLPAAVRPFPVQPPEPELPHQGSPRRPVALTQLYPRYIQGGQPFPGDVAVMGPPTSYHFLQVVKVRVRPVQYDPVKHNYIFYPQLRYRVRYDMPSREKPPARYRLTARWLEGMQELVERANTYLAKDIGIEIIEARPDWFLSPIMHTVDYVIITSDHTWPDSMPGSDDGTAWPSSITFPGSGPIRPPHADEHLGEPEVDDQGNKPVAHFERLAKWKTERGVPTVVVTVEQILGGMYGDCTANGAARDLQEVIRNFIKKAHDDWQFHYLLIGGCPQIVPMRYLLTHVTCQGAYPAWDFSNHGSADFSATQPPPRCCAVDANNSHKVRLCHDKILGTPTEGTLLCTAKGKAIPFKQTPGDGTAGWYFAKSDYSGKSNGPQWYAYAGQEHFYETPTGQDICNIVVEGPNDDVVSDHYNWAFYPNRFAPSDLYYACLQTDASDAAHPHAHDWDLNGNRLYGQFRWDDTQQAELMIDGSLPSVPDVWVGRAPIETSAEAKAFVDKVLTYEQLRLPNPDGQAVDPAYLKRIVLAADVLDGNAHLAYQDPCWKDAGKPESGTFVHQPDTSSLLVHLQPDLVSKLSKPEGARRHVLARWHRFDHLGVDFPVLRKQGDTPGWYFVKEQQPDQYVSSIEPTEFVKIEGAPFRAKPWRIIWRIGSQGSNDGATTDCEDLLAGQFGPLFPAFDDVLRYYVEFLNFYPLARDLTPDSIRDQLDLGCHFLVLCGHGNFNGASMVWWYETAGFRPDFKNRGHYFIAYSQSCYTAQPDYMRDGSIIRSLGEIAVAQPDGGAVAYIGYTRVGVGGGKLQQQIFWHNLKRLGRLGPAAGTPSDGDYDLDDMYQFYNQILYGDPNMPVWMEVPHPYEVVYPDYIDLAQGALKITVLRDGSPQKNQRVTLLGGWHGAGMKPTFFRSKVTGSSGVATFDLDGIPEDLNELTLTVTCWPKGTNFIPFQTTIPVCHFQDGWRRCSKCEGLFYKNWDANNPVHEHECPQGGCHESAGERYRLIANSPQAPGQQNWRWCKKCRTLFLTDEGVDCAGKCYNGQPHDGSSSGKYVLAAYQAGEHHTAQWLYCSRCRAVYRHAADAETAGPCFADGTHAIGADAYVVPTE
jgi:hypothetical protein